MTLPTVPDTASAQPPGAYCDAEVCITCSDAATPFVILDVRPDDLALVDTGAGQEEVSIALVTAAVGDTVLVHAGEAIAVIASGLASTAASTAAERTSTG